jgi:DNA polymerase-3 subunit gamma/tau
MSYQGVNMAYKVLYRKYRPMTFSDVVGQPQVTETLKNELMSGRISHAYLFTGTRGTGKTSCAKILAKAVNCLNPHDGDPCNECSICKGIDNGSVLDVVEIDAASNNGINNIRELIEESAFTPSAAKYRVYIIDEVHMLTNQAFNALLKTLEEPPEHVIFILATTEVQKVLPTILSRCQRFDFKRLSAEDIADRIDYICGCENITIDRDASLLIARTADGAMRDALSLLDQCAGKSQKIDTALVYDTIGIASSDYLFSMAEEIIDKDGSSAILSINRLNNDSKDLSKLCEELAQHFRKLMLIKTLKDPNEIINASESEIEKLSEQAKRMTLSSVLHAIDMLQDTSNKMNFTNQRVELEIAIIKLCNPESDLSVEALTTRVEKLEQERLRPAPSANENGNQVNEINSSADIQVKESNLRTTTVKMTDDQKAEMMKNAVRFNKWPEVLNQLKQYSQSVASAFAGSSAYTSGDYLLVDASTFAFDLLKRSAQRDRLKEAIQYVTGKSYKLGPYKKAEAELKEENSLDQLEKKAKEIGINVKNID